MLLGDLVSTFDLHAAHPRTNKFGRYFTPRTFNVNTTSSRIKLSEAPA